ncbi:putative redox protein [Ochrobactrum daejeonense]|uniref:Putative redox protein n=1 Tax=Brucella daejeonensis TaxID=659015 RepID=A0A7W9B0S1_9HYPH|nr:OsmC family protein [Brucella daejeonensis]MBB5703926.1 putative redox protein [Brucella daejeonensis]
MTPQENTSDFWEVVVATDPTNPHGLVGRVGATQFSIGVKDGASGMSPDLDPYDLLNASLAACTAMTVRFQAQRRELSLERVEVGVSFQHAADVDKASFQRMLVLEGDLDEQERAFLLEAANLCPVSKILRTGADIHTRLDAATSDYNASTSSSYADDLAELEIPNIDPD